MNTSSAKLLDNELLRENWTTLTSSQSKEQAKISYLMVEEVTPPSYMWSKVVQQLDKELKPANTPAVLLQSDTSIKLLLIAGAVVTLTAMLYFLLY